MSLSALYPSASLVYDSTIDKHFSTKMFDTELVQQNNNRHAVRGDGGINVKIKLTALHKK